MAASQNLKAATVLDLSKSESLVEHAAQLKCRDTDSSVEPAMVRQACGPTQIEALCKVWCNSINSADTYWWFVRDRVFAVLSHRAASSSASFSRL